MKNKIVALFFVILIFNIPISFGQICSNFDKKGEYNLNGHVCQVGIQQNGDKKYFTVLDEDCNAEIEMANNYFEAYFVDKISTLVLTSPKNLTTPGEFKDFLINMKTIYGGIKTSSKISNTYIQSIDDLLPYIKIGAKVISSMSVILSWSELYQISNEIQQDGLITYSEVEIFKEKFGNFVLNGILVFVALEEQGAKRAVAIFLQISPSIKESEVIKLLDNWETEIIKYPLVDGLYQVTSMAVTKIIDKSPKVIGSILISSPGEILESEMRSYITYNKGWIERIIDWIKSLLSSSKN